ncbi:hypothetical protein ACVILH_002157 [Bradyrhizobium sp. USDA 4353]
MSGDYSRAAGLFNLGLSGWGATKLVRHLTVILGCLLVSVNGGVLVS